MTGLVLCGGKSRRMGSDKGLLVWNGKTWAGNAMEKIAPFCDRVLLSVNTGQLEAYSKNFERSVLLTDSDNFKVMGPLLGLLSFHEIYPGEDVLLLACDMVHMQEKTLADPFGYYHTTKNKDAYLYGNNGETEPLCGIYTAAGLRKISTLIAMDRVENFSVRRMLTNLEVFLVQVTAEMEQSFKNLNTPLNPSAE